MAQKKTSKAIFAGLESGMQLFKWMVLFLVILFWFSGITSVKPGNVGMIMRFGRLKGVGEERILHPGLALAAPYPIDEVIQVPEMKVEQLEINEIFKPLTTEVAVEDTIDPLLEGYALTGDMNVIQTRIVVKYKVTDPIAFRLGVDNPNDFLHDIVLTSFVQTVGAWSIDDVLRQRQGAAEADEHGLSEEKILGNNLAEHEGDNSDSKSAGDLADKNAHEHEHEQDHNHEHAHEHEQEEELVFANHDHSTLEQQVYSLSEKRLKQLELGVEIVSIEFHEIHPPRHVNREFENVRNARTEIEEEKHKAEKYAGETIPRAQKIKNAMIQDAKTYQKTLSAQMEVTKSQFAPTYEEYVKNPQMVKQRVYLETVGQVFENVSKLRFVPPETKIVLPDEE